MNPLAVASRGKGTWNAAKRAGTIVRRYGLTSKRMERSLGGFVQTLAVHDGRATFPFTASALERSTHTVERHAGPHVEYAVHGYHHVDHRALPADEQVAQLTRAAGVFADQGLRPAGFRCPYLRWNDDTMVAVERAGFEYDSSQAVAWDVVDGHGTERYDRVLEFYGAERAAEVACLPRLAGSLVRIPYCLPDDEALIDRLEFADPADRDAVWPAILRLSHERGELFTLGLHPERFDLLEGALVATLRAAKELRPAVWMARLDEVAGWWRARAATTVSVVESSPGVHDIEADGPVGLTLVATGVESSGPLVAAPDGADRGSALRVNAPVRPTVGLSARTAAGVRPFLVEQGFIVEGAEDGRPRGHHVDLPEFSGPADERRLLDQIDGGDGPLVRLARWPGGARSALSITGDIDAMTLWDYLGRFRRS